MKISKDCKSVEKDDFMDLSERELEKYIGCNNVSKINRNAHIKDILSILCTISQCYTLAMGIVNDFRGQDTQAQNFYVLSSSLYVIGCYFTITSDKASKRKKAWEIYQKQQNTRV